MRFGYRIQYATSPALLLSTPFTFNITMEGPLTPQRLFRINEYIKSYGFYAISEPQATDPEIGWGNFESIKAYYRDCRDLTRAQKYGPTYIP